MLAATGCGGPLEDDGADARDVETSTEEAALAGGAQAQLQVRTTASEEKPRWRTSFSIEDTNTLFFAADGVRGAGPHLLVFEICEPTGNIYQRSEVTTQGTERGMVSMPVAATWIQQFAMTGRWKVKVFVDGAATPSGTNGFTLKE